MDKVASSANIPLQPGSASSGSASGVGRSHVNGKGLWRSWQRSFRQPVDALLDLIDNAFDANTGHGRVRISTTAKKTFDKDCGSEEGIILVNSFPQNAYKDMAEVLEVFKSQKDTLAIGENGVGVKQASASLSNFTLVITKNDWCFQIGILCSSLQKPEGVVIPSYTLKINQCERDLNDFCCNDGIFELCMQYFGGRQVPSLETIVMDERKHTKEEQKAFLICGKERLLQQLSRLLNSDDWKDSGCVFALWLDQLRVKDPPNVILEGLRKTLPKTYLHLCKPQCDILIDGEEPQFQYWERRLLELTCFPVVISKTQPLSKDPESNTLNTSILRIFVGFDPLRASGLEQACASLYIYSRQCGRLVKHRPDCRNDLKLPSGGSDYAQGLTIILDDSESSLPLTPTKQDIAWADGENGSVHETNVLAWLRAFGKVYYDHILTFFRGKKGDLTKEVKQHTTKVKALTAGSDTTSMTPMMQHQSFNKFAGFQWRMSGGNLVTDNKKHLLIQHGRDSVLRMLVKVSDPSPQSTNKRKRRKLAASTLDSSVDAAEKSSRSPPPHTTYGSRTAAATAAVNNQETDDPQTILAAKVPGLETQIAMLKTENEKLKREAIAQQSQIRLLKEENEGMKKELESRQ